MLRRGLGEPKLRKLREKVAEEIKQRDYFPSHFKVTLKAEGVNEIRVIF